ATLAHALGLPDGAGADRRRILECPEVTRLFDQEVARSNAHFGRYSQVKKYALLPDEWSVANGELTPTLKLKRKRILERYADVITRLYAGEEPLNQALDRCMPLPASRQTPLPGKLGPSAAT
ncbi:MAG: hypothetical protein JO069_10615, partial [Verrucomicrobia bacterium]|nr:hypothetical protein [Verrucomicrobiota bacterium]